MTKKTVLTLNGRFLNRQATGVARVAIELSSALSDHLKRYNPQVELKLALPSSSVVTQAAGVTEILKLERKKASLLSGYAWEQLELPWRLGSDWLLSFGNVGPVFKEKQVVMIHDAQVFTQAESYSWAFRWAYRIILPILARRCRILLTVSEFSKRELEEFGVFPKGKAVVVHNGVDHLERVVSDESILQQHGLKNGQFFLVIGSLAPYKNIDMLVQAANRRKSTTFPLVVSGDTDESVFLNSSPPTGENVRYVGRTRDEELKALYKNARALLFPSLTEGFGLPPLEAMSCGCPVVATTGGAVPEVCGDAVLYADPTVINDWTTAMDQLSLDDRLCTDLSMRGLKRSNQFTWKKSAAKLAELLVDPAQF